MLFVMILTFADHFTFMKPPEAKGPEQPLYMVYLMVVYKSVCITV